MISVNLAGKRPGSLLAVGSAIAGVRLSTFNIVIFGFLFGTGYVLTGELALPIGLHFAWNFVQGFVFGVVAEERVRVGARPHR